MKKQTLIFSSIAILVLGIGVLGVSKTILSNSHGVIRTRADDKVAIVLDSSNTPEALTAAYNNAVATPSRYTALTYHQAKSLSGYHCGLDNGGYIYNSGSAINNISRIVVNIEGTGTLKVGLDDQIDDFSFALVNGENTFDVSANYFKLIAGEEIKLVSLSVTYPFACESNPALPSGNPEAGLSFVRTDDNHIQISFVEDVSKTYQLRIDGVLAKTVVHDGDIIEFPLQAGSFDVEIRKLNNSTHTVSSWEKVTTVIADNRVSPLALNDTVDVFGWIIDGKPYGEGKMVYYTDNTKTAADATYIGTFDPAVNGGFGRKEGTHTYSNGMRYMGKFVNDAYHDTNGSFDWALRDGAGNVTSYGWYYEGGFANGTMAGQYGDLYFTDYFTHANAGIWKLEHVLTDGFPGYAANQTTTGGIWVSWNDTSDWENNNTYYGPINIDSSKGFNTTGLSGRFVVGCRENKETASFHPNGWYLWEGPMNNAAWPLDNSVGLIKWGYGGSTFVGKVEWHGENDTTMNTRNNYPQYAAYNYFWDGDNAWQADGLAGQGIAAGAKCIMYYGQFDSAWCKGYGVWIFNDGTYVKGKWEGTGFISAWTASDFGSYHAFNNNVDLPEGYRDYICKN